MQTRSETERVVRYYAEAWRQHDPAGVRQGLAPDVDIEWNLDAPVDDEQLIQVLDRISARAKSVVLVSETYTADGAALVYDCTAAFGTARLTEFIVVADGHIVELRQVHDLVAVRRYYPDLLENLD